MWFNQIIAYKFQLPDGVDIESSLAEEYLRPCPPHAKFIFGWMPVANEQFTHEISGCTQICFGKEERILPRGVIKLHLEERIKQLETQRGQAIKRSEKTQIAEDLEFELLPKAFCLQKKLNALIDHVNKNIIINTSSQNAANQLLAFLKKSIPEIKIEPIIHSDQASHKFAEWISLQTLVPNNLQLASDCVLFSPENEKKRLHCKGYELPSEEILTLISQGLIASELSLVWNDRVQFTLTNEFVLKRVKCLDYLLDDFNETRNLDDEAQQRDASLALLAGEIRDLLNAVFTAIPNTQHLLEPST